MAASSTLPHRKPLPVGGLCPDAQDHQPSVVRTDIHAVSTGIGSRSARRRTTPEAGFALEILGHAIEYLADEYVHDAGLLPSIHSGDPRVEAIQLLMAANRQVYYACPLVPSLFRRLAGRLFRRER